MMDYLLYIILSTNYFDKYNFPVYEKTAYVYWISSGESANLNKKRLEANPSFKNIDLYLRAEKRRAIWYCLDDINRLFKDAQDLSLTTKKLIYLRLLIGDEAYHKGWIPYTMDSYQECLKLEKK